MTNDPHLIIRTNQGIANDRPISSSSEETQLLGLGKNGINLPARDSRFIEL